MIQVGDFGYFPDHHDGPRFLGGAFSVDWRDRTHGSDWWPNEMPDDSDVARHGTDRLDILIAHDAPAGLDLGNGCRAS